MTPNRSRSVRYEDNARSIQKPVPADLAAPLLAIPRRSKGRAAEVRVYVEDWKGHRALHVRWFVADALGAMHPIAKGATVPVEHLPALLDAVRRAIEAESAGAAADVSS